MISNVAEPEKVTGIVGVIVGVGVGVTFELGVYALKEKSIPTELQYCPEGVGVGVTVIALSENPTTSQDITTEGVGVT
jgi:hypothetical protein